MTWNCKACGAASVPYRYGIHCEKCFLAIQARPRIPVVPYFSPEHDHMLVARTLAVISEIEQIDSETTTGEVFRKYVRAYIADLRARLPVYRSGS